MKKFLNNSLLLTCATAVLAFAPSSALAKKKPTPPEVTYDGLVRADKSAADLVYLLPNVDFSVYDKVILLEPKIAFRKNWKNDINSRSGPEVNISNRDMERMIDVGKDLFMDEFIGWSEDLGVLGEQFMEKIEEPMMSLVKDRVSTADCLKDLKAHFLVVF